jgi:ankyrin repeat protein
MPPKRASAIFAVVEKGDHGALKQLLARDKAAALERNEAKETPLHVACRHCYFLCVELLLRFGAPPNAQDKDGLTPLHLALSYGTSQMLPMLLRCGANPMLTDNLARNALHVATSQAMPKVVEALLLDPGVEGDEAPCPCCWQNAGAVDLDHHHQNRQHPNRRVPPNHVALVRQEDFKGNTPLHYATSDPSCGAVALQFLDALKEHADGATATAVINARNKAGCVALQYATYTGLAEVVEVLIEMGASEEVTLRGEETVLHVACEAGDLDTANTILNHLGDRRKAAGTWRDFLNAPDKAGRTALHFACLGGHLSCVRTLLRHADSLELDLEDAQGFTPLMVCSLLGYPQIRSLLEANKADKKKAKAGLKAKPDGLDDLRRQLAERGTLTLLGPSGKPMQRADAKGDGAISKKSYLLYWAILLAVAVCAAHYSYVTFQEYIVDYEEEYEKYKRHAITAWGFTVRHSIAAWHFTVRHVRAVARHLLHILTTQVLPYLRSWLGAAPGDPTAPIAPLPE